MKKYLVVLMMFCAFLPVLAHANDSYKDNSLQIDSSRLEEELKSEVKSQSALVQGLFSAHDKQVLQESKEKRLEVFDAQNNQLFTQKSSVKTDNSQLDQLFLDSSAKQYVTKVSTNNNTTSQTEGSSFTAILYGVACFLLICGASFATYIINKGED